MRFRLGTMSVGDVLDRGLRLLLSRLGTFYAINLIVQSPLIAYRALKPELEVDPGVGELLGGLLLLILTFVGAAAVLKVIEQEHIDRQVGVGTALGFALSRFFPLLLATIIYALVVGVCAIPIGVGGAIGAAVGGVEGAVAGAVLGAIPTIAVAVMFSLFSQTVVLERLGPIKGLDRSEKLTKGYRWRIFFVGLLILLVAFGVGVALALAFNEFLPFRRYVRRPGGGLPLEVITNVTNYRIFVVTEALLSILINTYLTICLTLIYFDLRTRKEGFDLELAALGRPQEYEDDYDDAEPRGRRFGRSRSRREDDYEEEDRPRRRRRDEADEDEDIPIAERVDDDHEDRPLARRTDEDREERPRRRRDEDEYEDRPRRRAEDREERPRARRDDEEDRPRRRRDADDDREERPRRRD